MKNTIILTIQIIIGLIFPFFWIIAPISQEDVPYNTMLNIIAYFILWVLPLIYFHNKRIKFLVLKIISINIIVFFLIIIRSEYYVDVIQTKKAGIRIDEINADRSKQIITTIENNKNYTDLDSINIKPVVNCYYLKWIINNSWFIFAYKYMSEENIKKYWKEYYIYSNPSDYKVSTEEYNKIIEITNTYCYDEKGQYINK